MTLIFINAVSLLCAIVMTAYSYKLYAITRSPGVLFLFFGCIYLLVIRATIATAETFYPTAHLLSYRSHMIVFFWPFMVIGFVLLVRALGSIYHPGVSKTYTGKERRKDAQ